jgi:hypothetical protein
MPGLVQVPGIGPKTAAAILGHREGLEEPMTVADLPDINGIGPKTMELVEDWIEADDPFSLSLLQDKIQQWRDRLADGVNDPKLEGGPYSSLLPQPTHTSEEVPYERTEGNVAVVWLGVIRSRNLKDLWESHFSRTGNVLDPADVKYPDKDQWVVMYAEDDTDVLVISVNRYKYDKFKDLVWSIELDEDLVLIRGYKMSIQARRAIYVTDMWILKDKEQDDGDEPETDQ